MKNIESRQDYHWSLFAMFLSACRPCEQKDFEGLMKPFYVADSEVMSEFIEPLADRKGMT